ncbi:hypothetical protein AWM75_06560 [Aerococcus urinaehominis]|uniref:Uncharacterized protein n=1 Tax=Aerococcus urinaehominis TaxID=128944 RepID=A0A0X8FLR8_9LACT|nr:cell division protein FtsQ/DivIB [Aerococcus urinaehominis]AMB99662.1 hypothetical protein AWM75_06560 [Aerococcus urinaehominis]SDL89403.1 Cell division septal protein FtsQ [Aerococcus urinaehominis]
MDWNKQRQRYQNRRRNDKNPQLDQNYNKTSDSLDQVDPPNRHASTSSKSTTTSNTDYDRLVDTSNRGFKQKQARQTQGLKVNQLELTFGQQIAWLSGPILVLVLSCLSLSPLNQVGQIKVTGNHLLASDQVITDMGIQSQMSPWFVWRNQNQMIQQLVGFYPQVKNAKINIGWRQTVVNVEENRVVGYEKQADMYYPLLETGDILNQANHQPGQHAPILQGFKEADRQALQKELAKLGPDILSQIALIAAGDRPNLLYLQMTDGQVVVAHISSLADRLIYYPSVAKSLAEDGLAPGLVDMQIGINYEPLTSGNNPFHDGPAQGAPVDQEASNQSADSGEHATSQEVNSQSQSVSTDEGVAVSDENSTSVSQESLAGSTSSFSQQ